jgi:hypothetical protein
VCTSTQTYSVARNAQYGGRTCEAANGATRPGTSHSGASCPEPCVGHWTDSGYCTPACGSQCTSTSTYTVLRPSRFGGLACEASNGATKAGSTHHGVPCPPVHCSGSWSGWSHCTPACDSSCTSTKTFSISRSSANGGAACETYHGHTLSTVHHGGACVTPAPTPTPIEYGVWGSKSYGTCSSTCGPGQRSWSRTCVGGNAGCVGAASGSDSCDAGACPIRHCEWSAVTSGPCVASNGVCGAGSIHHSRYVAVPASNGGNACTGPSQLDEACLVDCPEIVIHGEWCPISSSTCSNPCGAGSMFHTRTCGCPAPSGPGAKGCAGVSSGTTACTGTTCPKTPTDCAGNPCYAGYCEAFLCNGHCVYPEWDNSKYGC